MTFNKRDEINSTTIASTIWETYYFIGADREVSSMTPPSGVHYLLKEQSFDATATTINVTANPVLEVVSDAQWKEGPHAWKLLNGREFLQDDGFWDRCSTPEKTEQVVVKQRSEWHKGNVRDRFKTVEEQMGEKYNN